MSHSLKLLLPSDYVCDATEAIKKAKKRVSFLCMMVTNDEETDDLIDALCGAAERGVHVEVGADIFTYGELAGHFIPTRYYTKKARSTKNMTRQFAKYGVHFNWLGRFTNTPFSGRTHIKWCVVDDVIYSFGGVNLYSRGIKNTDYMFKAVDHEIASIMTDEYDRLVRADSGNFAFRSRSVATRFGNMHIDGGLPFDSVIYRRACTLAKEAKKVLLVSQYPPTGRLSWLLKKTDTKLYFNTGELASPLSKVVLKIGTTLTQNKTLYSRDSYLHAKFIIFYLEDGKRVALTGSHNFVNGGVMLGTREVALETEDPAVIDQLETFFKKHVA